MLRRSLFRCSTVAVTAAAATVSGVGKRADLVFQDMHGFELISKRRIKDLNLVAYDMKHTASGASLYHIDIDDPNNTFCIGFRTPAANNKGTSHVLEHTTLCGSQKYPVRDPFFMMLRRSLSTFMNAMTGADYTLYPFSTTNQQDFANLLSVYLDAVFRPLLREEDFHQEGHRIELEAKAEADEEADAKEDANSVEGDSNSHKGGGSTTAAEQVAQRRLVHNGVVYNEMRGVVSEPQNHFVRRLLSTMLPGTHYTYVSGGYPPDILTLTYDELVAFHRRHYHPSNSVTFTYGNQHPEAHMKMLNEYFSAFQPATPVTVPTLAPEQRFAEPKVVHCDGPLDALGSPKRQKRVAVSFGVPQAANRLEDVVELSVLDSLLASGPSSPMYRSLIETQIGSEYAPMRGYAYYLSSPIVTYGVAGVDESRPDPEQEVLNAVTAALHSVQKDGFDDRRVRSVVFQEELHQRHRAADYGLNLCTGLCAMALCRADNNPIDFINWLPHLQKIVEDRAASLLPRIQTDLLDNPHRAVISVSAKKDYLDRLRNQLKLMDDDLNANVTTEMKLVVERETAEWLTRVRAPQDSDALPTLRIADIPKKPFEEPPPIPSAASTTVHTIGYPTNGLVYVHGLIPFSSGLYSALAQGDLTRISPNLPHISSLIGTTGAGNFSFKDLSVEVRLVCAGFGFSPILNESYLTRNTTVIGTSYGFYTTKEKLKEALDLLTLTLLEPRNAITDPEVYQRVVSRMKMTCSGLIQSIQHQGNRVAVASALSRLTGRSQVREYWWGLSQSKHASQMLEKLQGDEGEQRAFMTTLFEEYQQDCQALAANLAAGPLWATCEERHRGEVEQLLLNFASRFPAPQQPAPVHVVMPPPPTASVAGLQRVEEMLPIDTSFVGYGLRNTDLHWRHPDQGAVRVACQLLGNEYLHRRVREEGGAYGSRSAATLQGEVGGVSMSSYRDPNPENTVRAFLEAGEWLSEAKHVTQKCVDEAKLRMFSSIDSPYAADTFGEVHFYTDGRDETKQFLRDELLRVTPQDVLRVSKYFEVTDKSNAVVTVLAPKPNDA